MTTELFAWKRLTDGEIVQTVSANTKDELFEACGFGAVQIDDPIKGFLAVKVTRVKGILIEDDNENK